MDEDARWDLERRLDRDNEREPRTRTLPPLNPRGTAKQALGSYCATCGGYRIVFGGRPCSACGGKGWVR